MSQDKVDAVFFNYALLNRSVSFCIIIRMSKKLKSRFPKINKKISVAKTMLAILGEIGKGTFQSFFPHPYYHTFCLHAKCKEKGQRVFSSTVAKLERRGLIVRKKEEGSTIFYLTPRGRKEAFIARLGVEVLLPKTAKKHWDGKWRFVFFDIPETKRNHRIYLRKILKTVGFQEFQKSVWVYPFPIPSFVSEILWDENIRQYTRFIVTNDIDYEDDLKRLFSYAVD